MLHRERGGAPALFIVHIGCCSCLTWLLFPFNYFWRSEPPVLSLKVQRRNKSSLTVEDVLRVIGPDLVVRVMTDGGRGQGRVAGHDVKAAL